MNEQLSSEEIGGAKEIHRVVLGQGDLSLNEFVAVARYHAHVDFSNEFRERVVRSNRLVQKFLEQNRPVYGLTTGFGDNVIQAISPEDAEQLQRNIVRSHAVSVGKPLDEEAVRAIQLMQLLSLGKGYSGIRIEVLELLAEMLNRQVTPYVPGEGSVGYLAVEGQMDLVLMGEGRAWYKGNLLPGGEALSAAGLLPVTLSGKEGLSLTNGANSPTGLGLLALYDLLVAAQTADVASAMDYELLKGTLHGCDERLHSLKAHPEQQRCARNLRRLLEQSPIAQRYIDSKVQDPYILRTIPHVHGASKRLISNAYASLVEEMHSCSDNPVLYPEGEEDGVALMGGNFDGTYVGSACDELCIAAANLAKFSERRLDRLLNRHFSGYPAFLTRNPGLNNGYMILQYTAAGLLAEIRILSHPATSDSIPTCGNQEDPVSMAYNAAFKGYRVAKKLHYILALELLAIAQAYDFLLTEEGPASEATNRVRLLIRSRVPSAIEGDRYFYPDIEAVRELLSEGELLKEAEKAVGPLEF